MIAALVDSCATGDCSSSTESISLMTEDMLGLEDTTGRQCPDVNSILNGTL